MPQKPSSNHHQPTSLATRPTIEPALVIPPSPYELPPRRSSPLVASAPEPPLATGRRQRAQRAGERSGDRSTCASPTKRPPPTGARQKTSTHHQRITGASHAAASEQTEKTRRDIDFGESCTVDCAAAFALLLPKTLTWPVLRSPTTARQRTMAEGRVEGLHETHLDNASMVNNTGRNPS